MVALFGFEISRISDKEKEKLVSFVPKQEDDGATTIQAGGVYGTYVDLDGSIKNEAELVTKYRDAAQQPEMDMAIDNVINDAIVQEDDKPIVELVLDDVKLTANIKKLILDEFQNILNLLEFNQYAYEIFRRWYIDGRLYYHVIVDKDNVADGIKELRYVDSRKMRKVVETRKRKVNTNVSVTETSSEYYIYSDRGFKGKSSGYGGGNTTQGNTLRIAKDSIVFVSSGLTNTEGDMILSYLHKALKVLNQLRALEDSLIIYRISRAPERRVFYIDVGNLPKAKAEQYVQSVMANFKNKLVYDSATGEIRDDRKFMCYALDTKIPLLDGRTLEIHEIIKEYNEGKQNWVYSCDPVTGKFVPGPISWAGVTKHDSDVVRVTFDNGKSVVCTPDHKFPVWGKGFIEAQNLAVGESLIPGYRRQKEITSGGAEYEQIFKNDTGTWEYTHREVATWKDERGLKETFVHNKKNTNHTKGIVHHSDFNRTNNNPENLVMMNHKDHIEYHHDVQAIKYTDDIVIAVNKAAEQLLSVQDTIQKINSETSIGEWRILNTDRNPKNRDVATLSFTNKDLQRICKINGFNGWREYRNQFDLVERYTNGNRIPENTSRRGSEIWRQRLSTSAKLRPSKTTKTWKVTTPNNEIEIVDNLNEFCRIQSLNRSNIKRDYGSRGYHAELLRNHKVVSVERLDEKMTVAALTIDQEETYHSHHTYLLDAGVYTKNTMLEDFWLPRREGGRGTEITTLPGGQNLSQIDDIEYFQQNLYKALNVPISRLQPESTFSFGRATEISRDEVKFAKFITRLRGKFSVLFLKLLETQLILKNIITSEDWEEFKHQIRFKFATDNYFDELKETEVLRDRIAMLRDVDDYAGKYYSHNWIRKTVLRQSEEEIDEIDKEIKEELNNEQYNPPADLSGEPDGGAPENPGVGDGGDSGGSASDSNDPGNQQIDLSSEPPQILGKLANRQDAIGLAAKQEIASRRSGTKS